MAIREINTLPATVYRQATHTDRLLDQTSYNPTSHKATTERTLTTRAQIACDSHDSLTDETKHLNSVFIKNNYSTDFLRQTERQLDLTTQTPLQRLYFKYQGPPKP